MKVLRSILCLAVTMLALAFLVLVIKRPGVAIVIGMVAVVVAVKRSPRRSTAFGSARWADGDDLRQAGMLEGKSGLILGRTSENAPRFWATLKMLFNQKVDAVVACREFMKMFGKPVEKMVKLSNAVHTAVFAPTGVGKGVSCVIPFLQTCPDSCVIIDFKGELATLTAEHREKAFGHKIVILDPFKVVTQ